MHFLLFSKIRCSLLLVLQLEPCWYYVNRQAVYYGATDKKALKCALKGVILAKYSVFEHSHLLNVNCATKIH
jgi:hypothetical protein